MDFFNRFSKYGPLLLRVGLAFVFIFAGVAALSNPSNWIGYIPAWVSNTLPFPAEIFLKIHASADILIGVLLLLGLWIRWVALAGALFLLSIVIFYGVDEVTFRDIGLIGALLSIVFMKDE